MPLGFADIVPSLQTGLVEAGENSVTLYARTGIAGEASHLTLTEHLLGMSVIVASRPWWDTLPEADRRTQKPGLMMASIYRTLLQEIAADPLLVLNQRVSLTPLRKFWLAWKVQALGRL